MQISDLLQDKEQIKWNGKTNSTILAVNFIISLIFVAVIYYFVSKNNVLGFNPENTISLTEYNSLNLYTLIIIIIVIANLIARLKTEY